MKVPRLLMPCFLIALLPAMTAQAQNIPMRFGSLRYAIGSVNDMDTILRDHINLIHLSSPASGWAYDGFPARAQFDRAMQDFKTKAEELRRQGVHPITYIAPDMWYGDKDKRTLIFDFFDNRWRDYEDFLGPRPADPLDWAQVNAKGQPIVYTYGGRSGYYWCDNDPRTRRYVQGVIRMDVTYGSHGVFFDGPAMHGCYCPVCQKDFRQFLKQQYPEAVRERILDGVEVDQVKPPTDKKNLPLFAAWKRFRCVSLARFLHDMRQYGRSLCPDFILTNNYCLWSGDPVGLAASLGEDGELYAREVDILFDEAAYGDGPFMGDDGHRVSNSFQYDYLVAAAGNKPAVCTYLGIKNLPPAALPHLAWLEIAESWASQCIKMQQSFRDPRLNEIFRQAGQFQIGHPNLFAPARPYAKVGLWVSLQQGLTGQATYGLALARLLQDQGVPYRILIDGDITPAGLSGLDCVIVPNTPTMSDQQLAALEQFARRGGGLVVLGTAATLDQYALPRPEGQRGVFVTAPGAGKWTKSKVGSGRLAWADLKLFPGLPAYSRTALKQPAAGRLAGAVRWAAGQPLTIAAAPPLPVECRVYRVGNDRLRIYLVNYGVKKDGTLASLKDVALTVTLPAGTRPVSAAAYSNAPAGPQAVGLARTNHDRAVRLTVPQLAVWDVIDLRLRQ